MPSSASAAPIKQNTPGQPIVSKTIKVSEMPSHPAGLKEAKHYKKMMEWYSKVEDTDGKLKFWSQGLEMLLNTKEFLKLKTADP